VLALPIKAVPSQQLSASLNGQSVTISIYQLGMPPVAELYCDISSDGAAIANCRKCRAYSGSATEAPPFLLLDSRYWGFEGDFLFVDTLGDEDPQYAGLGARWLLLYFAPADLAAIGDPTQQAAA
jgi:hypothetical protein